LALKGRDCGHHFSPASLCPQPIDPKWEFPRNRLVIEKILGEGEFGRVLRAKALDIAGGRGKSTHHLFEAASPCLSSKI